MTIIKIVDKNYEDPSLNRVYVKEISNDDLDKEISKFMRAILDRNNVGNIMYEFVPTKFKLIKDSSKYYARIELNDMDNVEEIHVYVERNDK